MRRQLSAHKRATMHTWPTQSARTAAIVAGTDVQLALLAKAHLQSAASPCGDGAPRPSAAADASASAAAGRVIPPVHAHGALDAAHLHVLAGCTLDVECSTPAGCMSHFVKSMLERHDFMRP
jgi:hypothetical protein